ncbi:MAG: serine/threonine-protein kinase PknK, partial [Deltaproteobacteria bacterium]|nr:serine/threonine-protein kinase PknK [Deltaproteobacteria bacterium]
MNQKWIYEGTRSSIYRGTLTQDDRSVIIKTHSSEYPTANEIERLRREFEIGQQIDNNHIIQYISLESRDHGFAIIEEGFHAEALAGSIPENGYEPIEFLKIAIQLAEGLSSVHLKNIIHKDINPHNILINNQSGKVKYIDFSSASPLEQEIQQNINSEIPQGSLVYISPEQSGRMNRAIDHRSDLYSLGITFYELLTGHLPFNTTDNMELVHCHIAINPPPPCELNKDIPQPISDIVIKLLSKNAEDRYQSSSHLKADLEKCHNKLETTGWIESFTLGHHYPSEIFYIPQKLYGRKNETKSLIDVFDHINRGNGYSGVGKTSLVKEMQKIVTAGRGNFISGEFDQLTRNVAYSAVIQAFQGLARQILSESEQRIQRWKKRLLTALGPNGQIIIDLIPEIELIIGKQPPVPEVGPSETRNRFNLFFKRFIQIFTHKDHPLILFLDNLQWADSASLNLIKNIATDFELNNLLIIGAYRDNEVHSGHPTKVTIDEIRNARGIVHDIHLSPLEVPDINHFITDTLGLPPEKTQHLAELVHHKTRGNPFFVKVFLQSLYNDGLIYFNPPKSPFGGTESGDGWQWEMEVIRQVSATDNVADFLVDRINQLPGPTIAILKIASCVGSTFNLEILSKISGRSREGALSDLDPALILGMVLQTKDSYSFVQSRVREAAFSLISDNEKKVTHLKTGRILLENTQEEKLEEKIFDIVNQLNLAEELITSREERNNLARLNLMAGLKAKASSAYEEAKQCFLKGVALLSREAWENEYDLTLALHIENCEAGNLTDDYEQTDKFFDSVIENAKNSLDKVRVYEVKMAGYWVFNKLTEAWELAKDALNMLGVSIPQRNLRLAIRKEKIRVKLNIGRKKIEELINLPDLKDPNELAIARIIMSCTAPSYSGENRYFPIMVLKLLNLTLKRGNSTYAAYAYAIYGAYLCSMSGDIEQGYRFGKLALKVLEKFDDKQLKCKVYHIFGSRINHWKKHIRENLDYSLEAYNSASETGDLQYMCFAGSNYLVQSIFMGETFEVIREKLDRYRDVMMRSAQLRLKSSYNCWYQLVSTLSGEVEDNASTKVEEESGPEWAELVKELFLSYLFGNFENAIKVAAGGKKSLDDTLGLVALPEYYFYYSLALLAHYPDVDREKQKQYLKQVKGHQEM